MAVLEIEALQKLLGIVCTNPFDRLADRVGGPAIARQRVSALLGRHGANGQNAGSFGFTHREAMIIVIDANQSEETAPGRAPAHLRPRTAGRRWNGSPICGGRVIDSR